MISTLAPRSTAASLPTSKVAYDRKSNSSSFAGWPELGARASVPVDVALPHEWRFWRVGGGVPRHDSTGGREEAKAPQPERAGVRLAEVVLMALAEVDPWEPDRYVGQGERVGGRHPSRVDLSAPRGRGVRDLARGVDHAVDRGTRLDAGSEGE